MGDTAQKLVKEQLLEQIYVEYLERAKSEEAVEIKEFAERYPEHRESILKLFELHREFGDQSIASDADTATLGTASPRDEQTLAYTAPSVGSISSPGGELRQFGNYELLEEIARGGMGVVFKARQRKLNRVVALKMILAGQLAGPAEVQRFHTEAEAAAQLDHPAIVPVFEVGEHAGLHFFSMGFVDGHPLSAQLVQGPLAPRQAAELLRVVAQAVQYAHDKGVVHRDLKPGNILLDAAGQPRITDFGLAKRTHSEGDSDLTGTGQILGTPSYMPPEQALGQGELIREPADIYALGAVLYATLTGRPPFQAATAFDTLSLVLNREPVPPRQLNPAIPLDLETICLKCLEKLPARRYASAQQVADELHRFLQGQPILARPIGPLQRAWRWCKRNRVVTGLLVSVLLAMTAGITVSSYFAVQEGIARSAAEASARTANIEAANLALNQAQTRCDAGEANVGLLWMVKAHGLALEAGDLELADACGSMVSCWLPQVPQLENVYLQGGRTAARYDGDGQIVTVSEPTEGQGVLRVFHPSGEQVKTVKDIRRPLYGPPINRAGTTILAGDQEGRIRLWSLTQDRWIGLPLSVQGDIASADFSPDDRVLATATKTGTVQFFDVATGVAHPTVIEQEQKDNPYRCQVRFHPDGKSVWITGTGGILAQHRITDGSLVQPAVKMSTAVWSLALNDQPRLLVVGKMGTAGLEFFRFDRQPPSSLGKGASLLDYELAFNSDGSYMLTGGRGARNGARFWDTKRRVPIGSWLMTPTTVVSTQFSKDGKRGLMCTTSTVEAWRRPSIIDDSVQEPALSADVRLAMYSARHSMLVTGSERDGLYIRVHSLEGGQIREVGPLPAPLVLLRATQDCSRAVGITSSNQVVFADLRNQSFQISQQQVSGAPRGVVLSPDGVWACVVTSRVEEGRTRNAAQLWEFDKSQAIPFDSELGSVFGDSAIAFNGDGSTLAIGQRNGLHLFRLPQGTRIAQTSFDEAFPCTVARFLPDREELLVARGNELELWDTMPLKRRRTVGTHDAFIAALVFSADGRYAASQSDDRTVKIWNLETERLQGMPLQNVGEVDGTAFSPDSRLLAVHSREMKIRIFHVSTGRMISPDLEVVPNNSANHIEFVNDERSLFAGVLDRNSLRREFNFAAVPQSHEQLQSLAEALTALSLEGQEVRILPREEWAKRRRAGSGVGSGGIGGGK